MEKMVPHTCCVPLCRYHPTPVPVGFRRGHGQCWEQDAAPVVAFQPIPVPSGWIADAEVQVCAVFALETKLHNKFLLVQHWEARAAQGLQGKQESPWCDTAGCSS